MVAFHPMYAIFEDGRIHSGKLDIILSPRENPNGYLVVTLDGEQLLLHRIVALHFLPNPWGYTQVNHKDGNKSSEQNHQYALKTSLRKGFVHVDIRRKLLAKVLEGETVAYLAPEVGNHPNTLNKMLREQAIKDGLESEWRAEAARKRKLTAVRNLEKVNARY